VLLLSVETEKLFARVLMRRFAGVYELCVFPKPHRMERHVPASKCVEEILVAACLIRAFIVGGNGKVFCTRSDAAFCRRLPTMCLSEGTPDNDRWLQF
jgi:hypothetical protein